MNFAETLPYVFLLLMAIAIYLYAILDGFDLGVGVLLPSDNENFRNQMIASIGPFWDANETWLVLAVGILLIAFPHAHSIILRELYLPTLALLIGLILRGVAFDFRAKAITQSKKLWDKLFKIGSLMASASQGFMLGLYVMGFEYSFFSLIFAVLSAICVTAAYTYIGCAWLVVKTEGELQKFAAKKGRVAGWITAIGIISICIANPLINPSVLERWLSMPEAILLMLIPLSTGLLLVIVDRYFKQVPLENDFVSWLPYTCVSALFALCMMGLAYSFYPYVIPNQLLAVEASSATVSLEFVFYGVVIVLPIILAYTFFAYRIFNGKVTPLEYY
ncbi:cytochrome d ubiquinol oxidase subunit II [Aliikangiella marina]|uniref:Cytochrome d ubiquinol oxidase subunit II n=1 Tax=Aliikangiella marina TaxID=1712262 RepID=A0A545T7P7_9GAMM|nr:cytochrome d ubiquinol oxidase subunit II [Aliikangiella marina]TQV73185.1 cytochrome d ubiquinol oxidase subunit II [Aliikangiella marina]